MKKLSLYKENNGIFHKGERYYYSTRGFAGTFALVMGASGIFYSNYLSLNQIIGLSGFEQVKIDNNDIPNIGMIDDSIYH